MRNDIDEKLKEILTNNSRMRFSSDDIYDDSNLIEDLGFDSASSLQVVMDIEMEFGVEFEDEFISLDSIETFEALKTYLTKLL